MFGGWACWNINLHILKTPIQPTAPHWPLVLLPKNPSQSWFLETIPTTSNFEVLPRLLVLFFFLGGGRVYGYSIYMIISYNIYIYMIYIEYIYIDIWYMKCKGNTYSLRCMYICIYTGYPSREMLNAFSAISTDSSVASKPTRQNWRRRKPEEPVGDTWDNLGNGQWWEWNSANDEEFSIFCMKSIYCVYYCFCMFRVVLKVMWKRVLFQTVPESTILIR